METLTSSLYGIDQITLTLALCSLSDFVFKAEEFQEVVQVMREFLPQAESELKYKTLPDDEMAIIQLIEKHEVLSCLFY